MDVVSCCDTLFVANQVHDQWLNNDKSCYKSRASYTLRTAPDRYPWLRQMDNMSVSRAGVKTFHLSDRWRFNLAHHGKPWVP